MNKQGKYNHTSSKWEDFDKFSDLTGVEWRESKADIWNKIEPGLENTTPQKIVFFSRPAFRYAVAAILVLMMSVTGVMRFYSHTVQTLSGEHLNVNLPDGSVVQLNAESSLKYYPLWWSFERKLAFTGEAYFKVEKGNKFVVNSSLGQTKVLGTSFNIYSREADYRVNCLTGKVQVKASNSKVVLLPNDQAVLNEAGSFYVQHEVEPESTISWIDNKFFFTSVPFPDVVEEIERQYGVTIEMSAALNKKYTGNFSREQSVEEVLDLLTRSFGVKFVQKQKGEYQIIQNR